MGMCLLGTSRNLPNGMSFDKSNGYLGLGGDGVPTETLDITGGVAFRSLSAGTLAVLGDGVLTTASDKNLKIEKYEIEPETAYNAILKLRPLVYEWREGTKQREAAGNAPSFGFFAQEVGEVAELQALVSQAPDGSYGLSYHGLTAPIVAALQFINTQMTQFHRQISDLRQTHHDAVNTLVAEQYQQNELVKKQLANALYQMDAMEHRLKALSPSDPTSHYQVLKSELEAMKKTVHSDVVRLENLARVTQNNLQTKITQATDAVRDEMGLMKCNLTNISKFVYQSRWQRVCGWFRGLFA